MQDPQAKNDQHSIKRLDEIRQEIATLLPQVNQLKQTLIGTINATTR